MPEWKLFRRWSQREIDVQIAKCANLERNFTRAADGLPEGASTNGGWRKYFSQAVVGHERPGIPVRGGVFDRLQASLEVFEFSDPRLVSAHFDPGIPLLGRSVLLEVHALGTHILCPTVISEVMDRQVDSRTLFGFRYDTLEGHLKRGVEWFLIKKDHPTGQLIFKIETIWKPAQTLPGWMRAGIHLANRPYEDAWYRMAFARLRQAAEIRQLRQTSPGRSSAFRL